MQIVITGSSGFVGTNLTAYLSSKFQITTLKLRVENSNNIPVDSSAVIHLAGKAHDLKNVSDSEEYYQVNFELSQKLYDAFLQSNAQKFIIVSSVKAAADHVNEPLTESYIPNPQTHYGKSKLMAEEYIQSQPLPEGKSYYILRPCMIHGPGNKGNLNLLYKFVSKGFPYPLAAFENRRSFLSVENFCFIIKELLERADIPSGVYNVADDEALSTTELVSILSKSLNKPAKFWHIYESWIRSLAKLGDRLHLPLNTDRLGKLTENYIVSNKKIKEVLKKELPLSAKEGILKTAFSFKNA
ncbi:NAD-dependent epimerase/dehydratase family protein [Rubrolithibacter danxiaensis]|uniref:NAD-dependent epimerase/dehydratase family protein n=1 Tax=Rubrolithibacter danxiaensis TaxID=3390805 RepID=UPI003BF7F3E8